MGKKKKPSTAENNKKCEMKNNMYTWKNLRKNYCKNEIWPLIIMFIVLICGVIFETKIVKESPLIHVNNYSEISLAAIQIQATIMSLTVAIIALISGQMDKSFLGVPYNKFYMQIKPIIFTQQRLIAISIILIPINIFFHILNLYNLVLAVLLICCILIFISIKQIYAVFLGTQKAQSEIVMYLDYCFREKNEYSQKDIDKMQKLLSELLENWKKTINKQTNMDFQSDCAFFETCGLPVLLSKNNDFMRYYSNIGRSIIEAYCKEDNHKYRAVIFLKNSYYSMWKYIYNNKKSISPFSTPFNLINETAYDLCLIAKECPMDLFGKCIDFNLITLSEVILRVEIWTNPSKKAIIMTGEQLNKLIRVIIISAAKQASQNSEFEKWLTPLKSPALSSYNIPQEYIEIYKKYIAQFYLHYALGLILGGKIYSLKDNLYLEAYNQCTFSEAELLKMAFVLQCYIYYLAEWETTACISEELIKSSKQFLLDNTVQSSYSCVIGKLVRLNILNSDLYHHTLNLLKQLEFMPKHNCSKTLVMEDAVRMFVYYSILYYGEQYSLENANNEIINVAPLIYATQIINAEHNQNCSYMKQFIMYHECSNKVEKISKKTDLLINKFDTIIAHQLKKQFKEKVEKNQFQYEQIGKTTCEKKFIQLVTDSLEEYLSPILQSPSKNAQEFNCRLHNIILSTDNVDEKHFVYYIKDIQTNFINQLGQILLENQMLKTIYKKDDEEFFNMLEEQHITHIAGGRYLYFPVKYTKYIDYYREYEKKINSDYLENGVSLFAFDSHKLKLALKNININIRDMTLSESRAEQIAEDSYKYQVDYHEIKFDGSELHNIIEKSRKVVEVDAKIALDITDDKIGVFIQPY